jgi:predicted nucleic acid-binding protein
MSSKFFFDTNILVYAISDQDPMRRERARVLLDEGGATSVQVLNELCSVMSRKFRRPHNEIEQVVDIFSEGLDIFPLTVQSQRLAMHIAARYHVGIYDANILATAEIAGLETVVSEDFSHRAQYGGVTVINPFLD